MPRISKTPGEFEGAQFSFKELLELKLEEECITDYAMHRHLAMHCLLNT